ncbi:DUF3634 family protein [Natronospira bacteriovora]|uniref:DUF3634 family protein n=1 Tax=Natronospira bacteriovora TaxID=3069753 RepID=A0ABU0W4T8_9GAMM|nr:DUF3634 family protein [Natronospira sp. AB-CW4]MDQ2068969.1 DUF3634 family protein [Natronospira sp. AB-CW4]
MPRSLPILARLFNVSGRIRFADHAIRETAGNVPAAFRSACQDIARLHRVKKGRVDIIGRGRRQHLHFSRDLPASACQAIANCWTPPPGPERGGARKSR